MKITGHIKYIWPREQVGQNNLDKCVICVRSNEEVENPPGVAMDLLWDKVGMYLDTYKVKEGDLVNAYFSMTYSRYDKDGETKCYNQIKCWKIEVVEKSGKADSSDGQAPGDVDDDLPF